MEEHGGSYFIDKNGVKTLLSRTEEKKQQPQQQPVKEEKELENE